MTSTTACPGCGARFENRDVPKPPDSLLAGPGCFAQQSELLASFYHADLMGSWQLVVDAYACSHPRSDTPRGIQATALSLMTLDFYLERGQPVADGSRMHAEMMRTKPSIFTALTAPREAGRLSTAAAHRRRPGHTT